MPGPSRPTKPLGAAGTRTAKPFPPPETGTPGAPLAGLSLARWGVGGRAKEGGKVGGSWGGRPGDWQLATGSATSHFPLRPAGRRRRGAGSGSDAPGTPWSGQASPGARLQGGRKVPSPRSRLPAWLCPYPRPTVMPSRPGKGHRPRGPQRAHPQLAGHRDPPVARPCPAALQGQAGSGRAPALGANLFLSPSHLPSPLSSLSAPRRAKQSKAKQSKAKRRARGEARVGGRRNRLRAPSKVRGPNSCAPRFSGACMWSAWKPRVRTLMGTPRLSQKWRVPGLLQV